MVGEKHLGQGVGVGLLEDARDLPHRISNCFVGGSKMHHHMRGQHLRIRAAQCLQVTKGQRSLFSCFNISKVHPYDLKAI